MKAGLLQAGLLFSATLGALLCTPLPAQAQAQAQQPDAAQDAMQDAQQLVALINAWRAAPGACGGVRAAPQAPLAFNATLARVQVGTGVFLEYALERIGYPVAQAEAVYITGPREARAVMDVLARGYCKTMLSSQFSALGAARSGDSWQIVFARPAPPPLAERLPDQGGAGQVMLRLVNTARASGRSCGAQFFPAAPSVSWSSALAGAALAHSADMARQRYFSHIGKDGRQVGERALQAGFRWRRIGENIAAGQESPEEAVAGWLTSPGHCANLMNAGFTDMGAAFALSTLRESPRAYWTQVFGTPR